MQNEELLKKALFEVKLEIGKDVIVDKTDLSYDEAMSICTVALVEHNENKDFVNRLTECMRNFGFQGVGGGGGANIRISAYMPREKTGIVQTCGRRMRDFGPWKHEENLDEWNKIGNDLICSFCGSLHPDRVIELIKEHGFGIVSPSDKSYKWYIHQPNTPNASFGGIKYYRYHDTDEFINKYNELVGEHNKAHTPASSNIWMGKK